MAFFCLFGRYDDKNVSFSMLFCIDIEVLVLEINVKATGIEPYTLALAHIVWIGVWWLWVKGWLAG